MILSALAGTLTPALVPLISQCSTTYEAWKTLAKTYANPTSGHLKQLNDRVRTLAERLLSGRYRVRTLAECN